MGLPQALTYFLVTITCTIIATIIYKRTSQEMGTEFEINSYKRFIACYLVFVISNGLCLWANYAKEYSAGYIFTLANLTSLCATAFFWYRFIEGRLGIDNHSKIINRLILIPLLIVIVLISTSMFTELVFYYTNEGDFARGPLYSMLLILPIFYIFYAMWHIIKRIIATNLPSKRKDYYYLLSFMCTPIIAGVIDMAVPHLPVMELSVLISIVLFYITFQDRLIYVDELTGMSNRRVADSYLRTHLDLAAPDNPIYFFLADCDDFKIINDVYGHLEGDKAIIIISEELEKLALMFSCHVSRWGGDEFVLIARQNGIPEPDALIKLLTDNIEERVREEHLPYELHISIGYVYSSDSSISTMDLFNEAERQMYRIKEKNKADRN